MPETEQEIGRRGVKRVQRLLEATLRFKLPYDAYEHPERVALPMLTGAVKRYDLNGDYLDDHLRPTTRVFVESKDTNSAGGQGAEFEQFLARAYSGTKRVINDVGLDPRFEFMWATTCPWKGDGFRQVASRGSIEQAVQRHVGGASNIIPADHDVDHDLIEAIEGRIWVWVVSDRQEDMTMSSEMRAWVVEKLERSE